MNSLQDAPKADCFDEGKKNRNPKSNANIKYITQNDLMTNQYLYFIFGDCELTASWFISSYRKNLFHFHFIS